MTFLVGEGFVQRCVVTIDNLARPSAVPRLWPVQPTPGKLQRIVAGDAELIAPDNARRYAPFVAFVASVEPAARRRCTGASTRCSSRPMPSWAIPRATSTTASSR